MTLPPALPLEQQHGLDGLVSGTMDLPLQQQGLAMVQVKLPVGAVGSRGVTGRTDGAEVLGYWTDEEMNHLLAAISKVTGGTMNDAGLDWSAVAAMVPSRSSKQCRQKWLNHLRPGISKEPWSLQEEYVLALMHSKIGNRWQELSRYLPSRPENTVKNHWSTTHRAKGYARIRTLLWIYCDLIVHQDQQPSADLFANACYMYSQLKGVLPIESFAVDENYFMTGPGSRRRESDDSSASTQEPTEPTPRVPVTVSRVAPPPHLKTSPLLELANAWAEKYHSNDGGKDSEQGGSDDGGGSGSGGGGGSDAALVNPCRASWLAHVRSAARQQQVAPSPDLHKIGARPAASAPAPPTTAGPRPPSAAGDAVRGPAHPAGGLWRLLPAPLPHPGGQHFHMHANYPMMHYQPKALPPGHAMSSGPTTGAQVQAMSAQQQQRKASAGAAAAVQVGSMHHKTYAAMQQHHRLLAAIHNQVGGPSQYARQLSMDDGSNAQALLQALHHQAEEGLQQQWRRAPHAQASNGLDGFILPGFADVRAAANSPRLLAGRWPNGARYDPLMGQCSPVSGGLMCDEDLATSPPRRSGAGGSPMARPAYRHPMHAPCDSEDGMHEEEVVHAGFSRQGTASLSQKDGALAVQQERELMAVQQAAAGDALRRARLADTAYGTHPVIRSFHDSTDFKRARLGRAASDSAARPQVQEEAAPAATVVEDAGEEEAMPAEWRQQRKRQRSVRLQEPAPSARVGRGASGSAPLARSGVDMLLALADAANAILADGGRTHSGIQAEDDDEMEAGEEQGPSCSPRAGSADATHMAGSSEDCKQGDQQQPESAAMGGLWGCEEGTRAVQSREAAKVQEQALQGGGQLPRSSSQLQSSSGASEPMAVGCLPVIDGDQAMGVGAGSSDQPHRSSSTGDKSMETDGSQQPGLELLLSCAGDRGAIRLEAANGGHAGEQHVDAVVIATATVARSKGAMSAPASNNQLALCDQPADGSVDVAIRMKGVEGDQCNNGVSGVATAGKALVVVPASGAASPWGAPAPPPAAASPWLQTLSHLATDPSCTVQERLELMKAYMAMVQQGLMGTE